MADKSPALFDAHLHPQGLTEQDLESMRFFGITTALAAADHTPEPTAKGVLAHFDDLLGRQLLRMERAGLQAYAALGVHPLAVPRRGLSHLLSALPGYFRGGKVVALGEIGLHQGTEMEEEAFVEQLHLAKRLKLPVMVHTPSRDKDRITRRTLNLLRTSGIAPGQVLVDHAGPKTVRLILECGHWAGLTIHPDELSAERAAALVRKVGAGKLVLDSDAGDGAKDLLGVARVASRLAKSGISQGVIARVGHRNAEEFFRVQP